MNYYDEIKNELLDNEINKKIKDYSKNKYELEKYYNVGRLLFEAGKHYGEGNIKMYSKRLTAELGKGYTPTRLRYYRRFYDIFSKYPTLSDKLTFSHYCEIIWFEDNNKINYYINISIKENLNVRELRNQVKMNDYERLPEDTRNNISNDNKTKIDDYIKNPIIIRNNSNYEIISEKTLQKLIPEDIPSFLNVM